MSLTIFITQTELEAIVLAAARAKYPNLGKDASVRFEVSSGQRDEKIVSAKVEA